MLAEAVICAEAEAVDAVASCVSGGWGADAVLGLLETVLLLVCAEEGKAGLVYDRICLCDGDALRSGGRSCVLPVSCAWFCALGEKVTGCTGWSTPL